jgi:hypothetical protein
MRGVREERVTAGKTATLAAIQLRKKQPTTKHKPSSSTQRAKRRAALWAAEQALVATVMKKRVAQQEKERAKQNAAREAEQRTVSRRLQAEHAQVMNRIRPPIKEVRRKLALGATYRSLRREYGLSPTQLARIEASSC